MKAAPTNSDDVANMRRKSGLFSRGCPKDGRGSFLLVLLKPLLLSPEANPGSS
jgi:hypothetical protein